MLELVTATEAPTVETVELFSIDGVTYGMPKKLGPTLAMKYLRMARVRGEEIAMGWALEAVIGEAAYTALMDFDGLTAAQLSQVMEVVRLQLIGATEDPK